MLKQNWICFHASYILFLFLGSLKLFFPNYNFLFIQVLKLTSQRHYYTPFLFAYTSTTKLIKCTSLIEILTGCGNSAPSLEPTQNTDLWCFTSLPTLARKNLSQQTTLNCCTNHWRAVVTICIDSKSCFCEYQNIVQP